MDGHAIGIDIGGTQLRAALVSAAGQIIDRDRRPTPADDPSTLLQHLAQLVTGLREQAGAQLPVGIGMAGLVTGAGEVRYGPNIAVRDLPLAAALEGSVGGHVVVANDASVAALGEQRAGAGAGVQDLIFVTLGTGVGGGLVVRGRLLTGASGFAGEVGHVVVSEHGRPCPCGNRGCLEAYASGTAIGALARDRLVDPHTVTSLRDLDYVGGKEVTAAARAGDRVAREVLEEAGSWLGVALASLVNALDPQLILLGGGASAAAEPWMLDAARRTMAAHLVGSAWRQPPPVELAVLGDDAGVVGAALLALEGAPTPTPEPG